jgi:hypothetical protein
MLQLNNFSLRFKLCNMYILLSAHLNFNHDTSAFFQLQAVQNTVQEMSKEKQGLRHQILRLKLRVKGEGFDSLPMVSLP